MKSFVYIAKIEEYDLSLIKTKISAVFSRYFSNLDFFIGKKKILLKPNLIMKALPQEAIVTSPVVVEAVGEIFSELGHEIVIADSPGGFVNSDSMQDIYDYTGLTNLAEKHQWQLYFPQKSILYKGFPLCWWAKEILEDKQNQILMVNLPKLKTHEVMLLTLAVKNLYGCISGLHKSKLHYKYPRTQDFSRLLLTIYSMFKPKLNIVDGILGLEGNGPTKKGFPRKLNVLAIGTDALATDYAIGELLGLKDEMHPIVYAAEKAKLFNPQEVEIISEFTDGGIKSFYFPKAFVFNKIPKFIALFLGKLFRVSPEINNLICKCCGVCRTVCPQHAIKEKNNIFVIDHKKCILCMCCREMCQHAAITLNKSIFLRFLEKFLDRDKTKGGKQ